MFGNVTKKEVLPALASALVVGGLFVAGSYFFEVYREETLLLIGEESWWSLLLYMAVFALSIVIAPISAAPLIAVGVQLWGIWLTTLLSVLGWTTGAVIAFKLARRFGEPLVRRMVAAKHIARLKKIFPPHHIFWTIFLFRTVTPFDGVSYVLGLVPYIRTSTHFWATLLGLIPFCLAMAYLGSLPPAYLLVGLVAATALAALIAWRMYRVVLRGDEPGTAV